MSPVFMFSLFGATSFLYIVTRMVWDMTHKVKGPQFYDFVIAFGLIILGIMMVLMVYYV